MKLAQFRKLRKSQDSWGSFLRLYKQEMIAEEEEGLGTELPATSCAGSCADPVFLSHCRSCWGGPFGDALPLNHPRSCKEPLIYAPENKPNKLVVSARYAGAEFFLCSFVSAWWVNRQLFTSPEETSHNPCCILGLSGQLRLKLTFLRSMQIFAPLKSGYFGSDSMNIEWICVRLIVDISLF